MNCPQCGRTADIIGIETEKDDSGCAIVSIECMTCDIIAMNIHVPEEKVHQYEFIQLCQTIHKYEDGSIKRALYDTLVTLGPGDHLSDMSVTEWQGLKTFLKMVVVDLSTK